MPSTLIVNADDLGYTPGVTDGIFRAHREGIVTAATLMATAPDAADAAAQARETSLDVGVHVVFTYGRALSDPLHIPSLVDAGGRFPRPAELLRRRHLSADEALLEARAQYDRARALLGREPTHIDTHHWVHDHPTLEEAVAALAVETRAVLRAQSDPQRARLRAAGIRTTDAFVREYQHAGRIAVGDLVELLTRVARHDGVTELMCHPGTADAPLLACSSYARERETELASLTHPRIAETVRALGIRLATFAAV